MGPIQNQSVPTLTPIINSTQNQPSLDPSKFYLYASIIFFLLLLVIFFFIKKVFFVKKDMGSIQNESIPAQTPTVNPMQHKSSSDLSRLFQGRVNRSNYIIGIGLMICYLVLVIVIANMLGYIFSVINTNLTLFIAMPLSLIFYVLLVIFGFSLSVRRYHDLGRSGWLSLLYIVPFVNLIAALILLFLKGQPQDNIYGKVPEPKIDIKNLLGLAPRA